MKTSLYSVRMRASSHGRHLSGAERIVAENAVSETTADLTMRAMKAANGPPEEVHCTLEKIDPATIHYARLPDVSTCLVNNWQAGRQAATGKLVRAGIPEAVAVQAVSTLAEGAGPGGVVMRGAVIMNATTGERLEHDLSRGVRVSRMDLCQAFRTNAEFFLSGANLGHYRVQEALVLAGKVLQAPGIVAELCWSDAPDYTSGYVSDPQHGYQRISHLKLQGDTRGGRVFFIDLRDVSLKEFVAYLERHPVLFNSMGTISLPQQWNPNDE